MVHNPEVCKGKTTESFHLSEGAAYHDLNLQTLRKDLRRLRCPKMQEGPTVGCWGCCRCCHNELRDTELISLKEGMLETGRDAGDRKGC